MGYLVNVVITYVTDAILSQQDITEEESNHLNELLRTLHPLEELFVLESGQVNLIHHASFASLTQSAFNSGGTCARLAEILLPFRATCAFLPCLLGLRC